VCPCLHIFSKQCFIEVSQIPRLGIVHELLQFEMRNGITALTINICQKPVRNRAGVSLIFRHRTTEREPCLSYRAGPLYKTAKPLLRRTTYMVFVPQSLKYCSNRRIVVDTFPISSRSEHPDSHIADSLITETLARVPIRMSKMLPKRLRQT
jgi:hypothetical protein